MRKESMKDIRKGVQRGGQGARKKTEVEPFDFEALEWDTISHSRDSMSKIMTAFARGEMAESKLRPVVYTSKALLGFLESERTSARDRQEQERDERVKKIVERLEALERAVHVEAG